MYKKNRKALAHFILDEKRDQLGGPSADAIRERFTSLYSNPGTFVDRPVEHPKALKSAVHGPVSDEDLSVLLRKLKKTSPGPDGVTAEDLNSFGVSGLGIVYNAMLLHGVVPSS